MDLKTLILIVYCAKWLDFVGMDGSANRELITE